MYEADPPTVAALSEPALLWQAAARRLRIGAGQAAAELSLLSGRGVLVLFDPDAGPAGELVRECVDNGRSAVWPIPADAAPDAPVRAAREILERQPSNVAVLGGGSAMDTAKLAVALAAGSEPRFSPGPRSGLALLTRATRAAPTLTAFPTTLGTGSETSAVARLPLGGKRSRLVCSPALRPTSAVLDPYLTGTLPRPLLAAGALELLLRLVGPLLGPHRMNAAAAEWLLECAATVMHGADTLLVADGRPAEESPAAVRERLASVSAASHQVWARVGGSPFAFLLWYLADTAATATGTAKNAALAWLFPSYLERAVSAHGPSPWADGNRSRRVVRRLFPEARSDPAGSSAAAAGLLRRWGIAPVAPAGADAVGLGRDAVSSWPRALTGITARDASEAYAAASDPVS
ncbi:iron-containing alcohol dehydrogenase [Streptomyces albicerus]|uniref:iron-containing alcohol dehydrogenase n=1 Tax=Streptomyces albicerus TaxID=2569859 RepID=UPI001788A472|nr:iron-containing alcohol dehydrogenase [Streptomyces albicerus]